MAEITVVRPGDEPPDWSGRNARGGARCDGDCYACWQRHLNIVDELAVTMFYRAKRIKHSRRRMLAQPQAVLRAAVFQACVSFEALADLVDTIEDTLGEHHSLQERHAIVKEKLETARKLAGDILEGLVTGAHPIDRIVRPRELDPLAEMLQIVSAAHALLKAVVANAEVCTGPLNIAL